MRKSAFIGIAILILLSAAAGLFFKHKGGENGQNNLYGRVQDLQKANPEQAPAPRKPAAKPLFFSYVINPGTGSFDSLRANLKNLDVVIGDWLHLADASGTIVEDNPSKQAQELDYIRANSPSVQVYAMLNNYYGGWRREETARMFNDPQARKKAEDFLVKYAADRKLSGISLDLEEFPASGKANFIVFLRELSSALRQKGMLLSAHAPFDDDNWDYSGVAQNADMEILMLYDEHTSNSDPGPVASMQWFNRLLRKRAKQIPSNKLVVGLGNYAYDWTLSGADSYSLTDAAAIAAAKAQHSEIKEDPAAQNDFYEYFDKNKNKHIVWMLDAVSVKHQLDAARRSAPYGFALYRLGSEDPLVWKYFHR